MNLDIFNNLAENLKNKKIVEKFIDELNKTLEKSNNGNIINNEELTTEYRDKMLLERNEILQKYADLTSEKGDMYYIYVKKDSYLATLSVLKINVDTTFSSSFPFISSNIFDTSVGYTFSLTTLIFKPKLNKNLFKSFILSKSGSS